MKIGPTQQGCARMHRLVEDELKHDVHDDPHGEQVADGRRSASQQFSSTSSIEEQTEQVGRVSRLGIGQASANPKKMAIIGCRMKRKRPGPVNRCGNSSRNCLENRYTRPVSMVSIIANGIAAAITRSASAVTMVSRRSVKVLPSRHTQLCLLFGYSSRPLYPAARALSVNADVLPNSSTRLASRKP